MKKISSYFFLTLTQLLNIFIGCKPASEIQRINLNVSGSSEYPVEIALGNFFPFGNTLNLIDTAKSCLNYYFVPGEILSINHDTTIYLFYPDSITVNYQLEKPIYYSFNAENIRFNHFYNDLSSILAPINQRNLMYFFGKTDSIISNKNFIDNYLSKYDSLLMQQVSTLCSTYQFPQSTRSDLLSSVLETRKLSLSYFYLGSSISKLDSIGILPSRLQYYIDKIDQQHVSAYSQKDIALLTAQIANLLMHMPIRGIRSGDELQNYYVNMQHYFKKGSVSYDYLVSSLKIQAKNSNIKLTGFDLKALKKDGKKSIFQKYVPARNADGFKNFENSPDDKNLYDTYFNSTDLSKVISLFKNKPLIIDFWASWCLPCLKNIPEIIDYQKKYSDLNIVFVSLDRSQDVWKLHLYEHNLMGYPQYRRNFNNQDSVFAQIQQIPRYGLFYKNGDIELVDELTDSLINRLLYQY